jgi:hypothetical protein
MYVVVCTYIPNPTLDLALSSWGGGRDARMMKLTDADVVRFVHRGCLLIHAARPPGRPDRHGVVTGSLHCLAAGIIHIQIHPATYSILILCTSQMAAVCAVARPLPDDKWYGMKSGAGRSKARLQTPHSLRLPFEGTFVYHAGARYRASLRHQGQWQC